MFARNAELGPRIVLESVLCRSSSTYSAYQLARTLPPLELSPFHPTRSRSRHSSNFKRVSARQRPGPASLPERQIIGSRTGPEASFISAPIFFAGAAVFVVAAGAAWFWSDSAFAGRHADSRSRFEPYTLLSKEYVSPTSAIYTLRQKIKQPDCASVNAAFAAAAQAGLWSIELAQPQLQICRAYTPMPPSPLSLSDASTGERQDMASQLDDPANVRLLVRQTPGEVPRFLASQPAGADLLVRGPRINYTPPESLERVVFLAGGTGIASALQLAHFLLETRPRRRQPHHALKHGQASEPHSAPLPAIHILWANRSRDDCAGAPVSQPATPDGWLSWIWLTSRPRLQPSADAQVSKSSNVLPASTSAIVTQLETLVRCHPERLKVEYAVDAEGDRFSLNHLERACMLSSNSSKHDLGQDTPSTASPAKAGDPEAHSASHLVVLSGPAGFIDYFAGPKIIPERTEVVENNGQSRIGGLLGKLGLLEKGWTVVKL